MPALPGGHGAGGLEAVRAHLGDDSGGIAFVVRVVGGDEPADDQVVELGLVGLQRAQIRPALGGHDGVMVADLAVVVEPPGVHVEVHLLRMRQRGVGLGQILEHLFHLRAHVVGQIAAVRARIGDELVGLVERLRQLERFVGREAELAVGLALQAGQVEQLGRREALVLQRALGDPGGLALHLVAHALGGGLVGNARFGGGLRVLLLAVGCFRVGIDPKPLVIAKIRLQLPVILRNEGLDLPIPPHDQAQRGRLHPAHGQVRVVFQRKGAAGVHAHQPVGLTAAAGAFIERVVGRGGLEGRKALLNGRVGHGRNPQPLHGLGAAGHLIDVAKDQLALPGRVRGADDGRDLAAVHQLLHRLELAARVGQHLQRDALGQHGQRRHGPFLVSLVEFSRLAQGDQMADGPGDDVFLAIEKAVAPALHAQHPGDVPSHGGLFRDDQLFHVCKPASSYMYHDCRRTAFGLPNHHCIIFLPENQVCAAGGF